MSSPQAVTALDAPGYVLYSFARDVRREVESYDWLTMGLERVGWAFDAISLRVDPFGTVAAWAFTRGLGWLVESVQPVQDLMNQVIGDPERVKKLEDEWRERAKVLQQQESKVDDTRERVRRRDWRDGDASRDKALDLLVEHAVLLGAGSMAAFAVAAALRGAGGVVVAAHSIVVDLAGQLLATLMVRVPTWIAAAGASLGTATPVVVAQVQALVAQCMRKIADFIKLVISSLVNLRGHIDELRKLFTGIRNTAPKLDPELIPPPQTGRSPMPVREMHDGYVGENLPDNKLWIGQVRYLSERELEQLRIIIHDGKLYDITGKLFDTTNGNFGQAIFVMDAQGNFYASNFHRAGEFHHSSFFGGKPVAGAGNFTVVKGEILTIDDSSGHYRPSKDYGERVNAELERQGVKLEGRFQPFGM